MNRTMTVMINDFFILYLQTQNIHIIDRNYHA
jgi:hypothetical protein